MEDPTEEKQNFLRENILEKGYDTNQFINFLKSKKGGDEGADISSWSMPDLQQVVQEFINLSTSGPIPQFNDSTDNIQKNPNDNSQINPQINENSGIYNQNMEELGTLKEEDFGIIIPDFIECRKSETTELCKYNKIEITVNDPKKVDKGFFSKAYIDFAITTNPCNLVVRRQHAEFVWLRERLSVIFNTNVLPRLPKKGKVNGDPHIQKRMRNLEKFLNYLIKDPIIKTSQILFDFLSCGNEEEYNKRKKIYNKMRTPTDFSDIKSINGKTRIKITEIKEKYINNIKDNAALNETAFKKFNQNFKALREEMNTTISRVLSFSPLFDKLIKISTNFAEDDVIIESYKQMKNLFNSWADILKRQNSFFCNDVKEYFKLISGNYHHIRDLVQVVENQKSSYYKISKNLISKKMELFRKGDVSNWQLDVNDKSKVNEFYKDRAISYKKICFKETNYSIINKQKYGYYLNRLISEYVRMKNINAAENKEKVKLFSKKQAQIASDYFKQMGEILILIDGCMINDAGENLIEPSPEENNNINQQQQKSGEEEGQINTENYEENKNEIKEENKINDDDNNNKIIEKE